MKTLIYFIFILGFLGEYSKIQAQNFVNADSCFNHAALKYIKEDKMEALKLLKKGLDSFPDNEKLRALADSLLKDEQKKDKQREHSEQNKDQQNKQDQQQQQQEQQNKDQQEKKDEQQKQDQQQANNDKQEKDQQQKQDQPKPDEISKENADRMLDALNKNEQDLQKELQKKKVKVSVVKIEKDW